MHREHRTRINIVTDILYTARDEQQESDGTSVTYLIRRANLPHARITEILNMLVSQGLMEKTEGASTRYRISATGREFLEEYHAFTKLAESFGLTI